MEWMDHFSPPQMTASLPTFKAEMICNLVSNLQQQPCRKNLEKIIGILLWATSLVHHVRFLLASLYRDLFAIPATNYSIRPTLREHFLDILTDDAIISRNNDLSQSSDTLPSHPKPSFLMMYPSKNTFGSVSETLTRTKGSFPKNVKPLCFGFLTLC